METKGEVFEAKLKDTITLRKIIEAIKEIVKDINIEIKTNGITIQAMDVPHVALIHVELKEEGFVTYKAPTSITIGTSDQSPVNIGVNTENLLKAIKLANDGDSVTLKTNEEATKLNLSFQSESNSFLTP